jgi:hypothetical protein
VVKTAIEYYMKKLIWLEIGILSCGWLSSIFFILYAQGIFESAHKLNPSDIAIGIPALIFAIPYVLVAWLYKKFDRFSTFLLISSLIIVGVTINAFYSIYIASPAEDAGCIFIIVFIGQMLCVVLLAVIIFIINKLLK